MNEQVSEERKKRGRKEEGNKEERGIGLERKTRKEGRKE